MTSGEMVLSVNFSGVRLRADGWCGVVEAVLDIFNALHWTDLCWEGAVLCGSGRIIFIFHRLYFYGYFL